MMSEALLAERLLHHRHRGSHWRRDDQGMRSFRLRVRRAREERYNRKGCRLNLDLEAEEPWP